MDMSGSLGPCWTHYVAGLKTGVHIGTNRLFAERINGDAGLVFESIGGYECAASPE